MKFTYPSILRMASMKNKKIDKLDLIIDWFMQFPCEKYFKNKCIIEYLTPEELMEFIEEKSKKNG